MTTTTASAGSTTEPVGVATSWTMLVGGLAGALASAMLLIDRVTMLKDRAAGKTASLSCDVNAHISCSSVLDSKQAEVFGFPSPVFGLPAFTALAVLGLLLVLRTDLPRIVWWGLQAGVVLAIAFMVWLQVQSIWVLRELCPWCLVVWTATIPVFVLVTAHVSRWRPLRDWAGLVIALWYLLVVAAVVFRFFV